MFMTKSIFLLLPFSPQELLFPLLSAKQEEGVELFLVASEALGFSASSSSPQPSFGGSPSSSPHVSAKNLKENSVASISKFLSKKHAGFLLSLSLSHSLVLSPFLSPMKYFQF